MLTQITINPQLPKHCALCRVTDSRRSLWACACGAQLHRGCAVEFKLGVCPTLGCEEALPAAPKTEANSASVEVARPAVAEATPRFAGRLLAGWGLASAATPFLTWAVYAKGYESYAYHVLHHHYRLVKAGEFGLHVILPAVLFELTCLIGVGFSMTLLRRCKRIAAGGRGTNFEKEVLDAAMVLGVLVILAGLIAAKVTGCSC